MIEAMHDVHLQYGYSSSEKQPESKISLFQWIMLTLNYRKGSAMINAEADSARSGQRAKGRDQAETLGKQEGRVRTPATGKLDCIGFTSASRSAP